MSFVSRHSDHLLQIDWQTIAALALICAVAAFFITDCRAHPPVVVWAYPLLRIFSILAPYVFEPAELFTPKKLDQWLTWTLRASTCRTLFGPGLLAAVVMGARPVPATAVCERAVP